MCKRELGFPRNLGDPTHNTPQNTTCLGGADRPMVCVRALLELARWCQQRQEMASGGDPCVISRTSESPPARFHGGESRLTKATLEGGSALHSAEGGSNAQSPGRSATPDAANAAGGGA